MTMKTPSNALELMENLRDALRSRLIFDEAFYTEENVKNVTAAQQVEVIRHQENPLQLEVEAFDFQMIADNLKSYGGGISIEIMLEKLSDGKKCAFIRGNINRDQPLLHFLTIKKMIGHNWRASMPEFWSSNRLYRDPIDPYGNLEQEYSHKDGDIEEKGFFTFNPAGHLNGFFLRSEEQ